MSGKWHSHYKIKEKFHVITDTLHGTCECGAWTKLGQYPNTFTWQGSKVKCMVCNREYEMVA